MTENGYLVACLVRCIPSSHHALNQAANGQELRSRTGERPDFSPDLLGELCTTVRSINKIGIYWHVPYVRYLSCAEFFCHALSISDHLTQVLHLAASFL